jgi:hypothetical protein
MCAVTTSRRNAKPGAGHADDQIEFAGLQLFHEAKGVAMPFQGALLHRRGNEGVSAGAADEYFDFLRAAAFQTQNPEPGE